MRTILIMSGKGGVGKTTISIGVAKSLSRDYKCGVYDTDFMCPNGPRLLGLDDDCRVGLEDHQKDFDEEKYYPVKFDGMSVFSTGFMLPLDAVMTLEGDRRSALLKDFTSRLDWGDIDYLIVDLPPGTGDENLAVIESAHNIVGAVIVVTGKHESIDDAGRVLTMLDDVPVSIPVIGVVRNMSHIDCPGCKQRIELFNDELNIEAELGCKVICELPYKNLTPADFNDIAGAIVEFCGEEECE
ncbi:MAG: P-loop NTPase [Chloroflexota bacterium]|nr:P-loop NTPase [Chloroflexota bacterium]